MKTKEPKKGKRSAKRANENQRGGSGSGNEAQTKRERSATEEGTKRKRSGNQRRAESGTKGERGNQREEGAEGGTKGSGGPEEKRNPIRGKKILRMQDGWREEHRKRAGKTRQGNIGKPGAINGRNCATRDIVRRTATATTEAFFGRRSGTNEDTRELVGRARTRRTANAATTRPVRTNLPTTNPPTAKKEEVEFL